MMAHLSFDVDGRGFFGGWQVLLGIINTFLLLNYMGVIGSVLNHSDTIAQIII